MQDADEKACIRSGGIAFLIPIELVQDLRFVRQLKDSAGDGLLRGRIEDCARIAAKIV